MIGATLVFSPLASQAAVAYTGTAATSAAIGAQTTVVRVVCSSDAFLAFSTAGTAATTSGIFMPAGKVEYFRVQTGVKISAVQNSAGGNMYVTEMDL